MVVSTYISRHFLFFPSIADDAWTLKVRLVYICCFATLFGHYYLVKWVMRVISLMKYVVHHAWAFSVSTPLLRTRWYASNPWTNMRDFPTDSGNHRCTHLGSGDGKKLFLQRPISYSTGILWGYAWRRVATYEGIVCVHSTCYSPTRLGRWNAAKRGLTWIPWIVKLTLASSPITRHLQPFFIWIITCSRFQMRKEAFTLWHRLPICIEQTRSCRPPVW